MKTLLIHDNDGKVFFNITGDNVEPYIPNGLQYIIVEIPEGKKIIDDEYQIDLSNGHPVVKLEDIPKSEIELLKEELQVTQEVLNFFIMNGGI